MALKINMFGPFVVNFPFGTEIAFKKGFERLGHDVRAIDPNLKREENPSFHEDPDFTLVFKDAFEYNRVIKDEIRGPKILYQPDDQRFTHIRMMMRKMREICNYVLTFDNDGAKRAITEFGYDSTSSMLVTADNDLYHPESYLVKDIDVSFIASFGDPVAHASRRKAVEILQKAGIEVIAGTTNDTNQIRSIYNRSKIVVNHATDVGQRFGYGYGFQCRHFEVGFTKTCFLSNFIIDESSQMGPKFFWRYSREEDLLKKVEFLLSSEVARTSQAELFYQELTQYHLPEHRAKQIISFVETL